MITEMDQIKAILEDDRRAMTLPQIISEEIRQFKASEKYSIMVEAERYYRNRSAIQDKIVTIADRSNAKIEHPVLKKVIDQKTSYLLSKSWTVDTNNETYADALNTIFDRPFRKKVKALGSDAIKSGISYLQPYFSEDGKLAFMRVPSVEIIPLWSDSERSELDGFIRFFDQTLYFGTQKQVITRAEFWDRTGVKYFISDPRSFGTTSDYKFKPDIERAEEGEESHFMFNGVSYNWEKVPLVWLRYNEEELPLNYFIKEFIDDINFQTSLTADLLRDVTNFIYVLRNYGGQNLAEFLRKLNEYKAINVTGDGGVDKLQADLDIQAVMAHLDKQRRDLYDFAAAVDTKDPNLGTASGTAINFRYMDLDNDCENLASELQDTFYLIKSFIDTYLQMTGKGDFTDEVFSVVFNMDLPVNETDIINNIRNSEGIISKLSMIRQHPWVEDAEEEMERLESEKKRAMETFGEGLFGGNRYEEQDLLEE